MPKFILVESRMIDLQQVECAARRGDGSCIVQMRSGVSLEFYPFEGSEDLWKRLLSDFSPEQLTIKPAET